jgi:hypothetical protein
MQTHVFGPSQPEGIQNWFIANAIFLSLIVKTPDFFPPEKFFCSFFFNPLHHSPSPLLKTISTSFIVLFSYMNTKYTHHIHSHSLFPYSPSPLLPTSRTDLFYPLALHFFKVYIGSPRGFSLGTSCLLISYFNQMNPPITCSFSITMLPLNIQQLKAQYVILHSYIDRMFQYFSFSNIFFPTQGGKF